MRKIWFFWLKIRNTLTAPKDKSVLNMAQKTAHFDPNKKGLTMNIFISILLVVMAGVIFCQNWQMEKFRKGVAIYRYYAKLQECRAVYAKEESASLRELIEQLGYDIERLGNGDTTQKVLTDAD